ncbi:DUF6894 family protein [Methylobacterium brachythecii]|uniref:DUF6894 family protein n=1 Tax=Methylobacterium brachythecii TaxID=1176177 RepID=UPI003CCE0968
MGRLYLSAQCLALGRIPSRRRMVPLRPTNIPSTEDCAQLDNTRLSASNVGFAALRLMSTKALSMPKYFFYVHDGIDVTHDVRLDFADHETARDHARSLIATHAGDTANLSASGHITDRMRAGLVCWSGLARAGHSHAPRPGWNPDDAACYDRRHPHPTYRDLMLRRGCSALDLSTEPASHATVTRTRCQAALR